LRSNKHSHPEAATSDTAMLLETQKHRTKNKDDTIDGLYKNTSPHSRRNKKNNYMARDSKFQAASLPNQRKIFAKTILAMHLHVAAR
jgi:hypothetical protein